MREPTLAWARGNGGACVNAAFSSEDCPRPFFAAIDVRRRSHDFAVTPLFPSIDPAANAWRSFQGRLANSDATGEFRRRKQLGYAHAKQFNRHRKQLRLL